MIFLIRRCLRHSAKRLFYGEREPVPMGPVNRNGCTDALNASAKSFIGPVKRIGRRAVARRGPTNAFQT